MRMGTVAAAALGLLLLSLGVTLAVAGRRWRADTDAAVTRLSRTSSAPSAAFSMAELEGLPTPVARYFRAVLSEGQPIIRRARVSQRGEFLVQPTRNAWRPFLAEQHFTTRPAGFVWDARIRAAPGLDIRVRDSLVEGSGSMIASFMGLGRLASIEGTPEIAAGALHRYLAEAVLFPTALLPSQGVLWTPLDDFGARAMLRAAITTVALDFHFGADGLVQSVFTPARSRDVDGRSVATPWRGHWRDYQERDGMRVPLAGEVEWLLPQGPQPYWRGQIVEIAYERG